MERVNFMEENQRKKNERGIIKRQERYRTGERMDTSKKYIKMCKEATEIQKLWKAEEGDFYFCECKDIPNYPEGYGNVVLTVGDADLQSEELYTSDTDTWLPRQDQLQDMVTIDGTILLTQLKETYIMECWIYKKDEYYFEYNSMEQLWLAFVMKEKYGKVWDDENECWKKE